MINEIKVGIFSITGRTINMNTYICIYHSNTISNILQYHTNTKVDDVLSRMVRSWLVLANLGYLSNLEQEMLNKGLIGNLERRISAARTVVGRLYDYSVTQVQHDVALLCPLHYTTHYTPLRGWRGEGLGSTVHKNIIYHCISRCSNGWIDCPCPVNTYNDTEISLSVQG